jgi:hypothetical protein
MSGFMRRVCITDNNIEFENKWEMKVKVWIWVACLFVYHAGVFAQTNLASHQPVFVNSEIEPGSFAAAVVDGVLSDRSVLRFTVKHPSVLIVSLDKKQKLGGVHLYFGYPKKRSVDDFYVEFWHENKWKTIPSAVVTNNSFEAVALAFDATVPVWTDSLRFTFTKVRTPAIEIREIAVWPVIKLGIPPLGTGVSGYEAPPEIYVPKIYINQSGYNLGKPKRFTAPLVDHGTPFYIREARSEQVLFRGLVLNQVGDFSAFNPSGQAEYIIVADTFKSFPFRIGQWWIERTTYQHALNFMIDSRHYVGNYTQKCSGSYGWRDDSHFGWELHTLVPQYLSNPAAYERMPRQVSYQAPTDTTLWGALQPYDEKAPDIVKLIHWGADVIVTQKLQHEHFKGQLAYFLYAWPYIKQWMPRQNYEVVKAYALQIWRKEEVDQHYAYNESAGHHMLALKTKIGSTKGALPPGASVIPNLMMYEVAKRDGMRAPEDYFNAAYRQVKWMIDSLQWDDPITTKGQRMSEFITPTSLAYMLSQYPTQSPAGLKRKLEQWAEVLMRRSNNMWDFRKLDDSLQWCPTGTSPQHWNETGNIVGLPSAILSVLPFVRDSAKEKRLLEIAFAHLDNAFGRNPCGRHCSFDAAREIEGVELGWYHQHAGGIGQLSDVRFVLDGSPKNAHYPYHPERGDIGWTEGWVSFNVCYNLSLSYLASFDTEWSVKRNKDFVTLRLKAPLNFDYKAKENVWVQVKDSKGKTTQVKLTEESANAAWFSATIQAPTKPAVASYGFGYFEKRVEIPAR